MAKCILWWYLGLSYRKSADSMKHSKNVIIPVFVEFPQKLINWPGGTIWARILEWRAERGPCEVYCMMLCSMYSSVIFNSAMH